MRYIRQEIFKEVGKKGQEKLRNSTIVIVGLGALGSVSAELLARAGIGKLVLIDRDIVELSNLQRQSLFDENDIGKPKALAAKEKLIKINSEIKIDFYIDDLNFENIGKIINAKNADLILDCTDNLETRFLINDFCIKNKMSFIHSSAVGSKGYLFNILPEKNSPCLRCFLKEATQLETCETFGVLNSITHTISSIQANEAIKILVDKESNASEHRSVTWRASLVSRASQITRTRSQLPEKNLLFFDVWKNELLKIKVNKNSKCICCTRNDFEYLSGKKSSRIIKMCGNDVYQIKNEPMNKIQFNDLKNKLKKIGKVIDFKYCINFYNKMTIFENGRALIKAKSEKEAKSLYSRFVGN